jgi:hypothetical protein
LASPLGESSRQELDCIDLEETANCAGPQIISTERSKVAILVIKTDEERMIAEYTRQAAGITAVDENGGVRRLGCQRNPH